MYIRLCIADMAHLSPADYCNVAGMCSMIVITPVDLSCLSASGAGSRRAVDTNPVGAQAMLCNRYDRYSRFKKRMQLHEDSMHPQVHQGQHKNATRTFGMHQHQQVCAEHRCKDYLCNLECSWMRSSANSALLYVIPICHLTPSHACSFARSGRSAS